MRPLNGEDGGPAGRGRGRAGAPRRDPAPSRIAYRLNRLWLRPTVRRIVRTGLPVAAVLAALGVYFGDAGRRQDLADRYAALRRQVEERPEFMVRLLSVEGTSSELAREVRAALPLNLPVSSFDLDLDALRAAVETLDAVAAAELRIRPGGVLQLIVTERQPAAVWRGRDTLELIDATGHRVAAIEERAARADLPLIAGDGAPAAVAEALELIAAAAPIAGRVRGLVRMGERRWDLVLDRDQRILLPADDPVPALERAIALDQAQDLLARDVLAVDLRIPDRPTLRLSEGAAADFRRAKATLTGADEG